MIASNALGAFSQEIGRTQASRPVQAPAAAQPSPIEPVAAQRKLEAVPPPPAAPLPRGSLLDLRI